ncbi:MAG: hypothetical protein QXT64_01845 [Desulfurococcaceae archaeon]
MARGTFKRIVASTNKSMSEVRSAFGRTAADLAKDVMNDELNKLGPNQRSVVQARPGDFWRTVVRHVYKAVARVIKDKLYGGTLSIGPDGKFNVTKADILPHITALPEDLRRTLSEAYKLAV